MERRIQKRFNNAIKKENGRHNTSRILNETLTPKQGLKKFKIQCNKTDAQAFHFTYYIPLNGYNYLKTHIPAHIVDSRSPIWRSTVIFKIF